MVGNAVLFDHRDEVPLRVSTQRRNTESRVSGDEPGRLTVRIGEVAAPTARHQDLLADPVGTFEDNDTMSAIAGGNRTHEPGGTTADNDYVDTRHRERIAGPLFLDVWLVNWL